MLTIIDDEDITFDSVAEKPFEEVLKLFSVSVVQSREDIYEKMLNFIEIVGRLHLVKLLVFVNVKSFFDEKQLAEIYKMATYREVSLLLIDNKIYGKKIAEETLLAIDKDYVEKIL